MDDRDRELLVDPGRSIWFIGDLDDHWVASIAEVLPSDVVRIACPGDLPEALSDPVAAPSVLVLHRAVLTRHDAERLKRLRTGRTPPTRVVLCHGPHVRCVDLERWVDLYDAAVPEATARDTIARRVFATGDDAWARRPSAGARPKISVVSTNLVLRQMLAEACETAGYPVTAVRDWSDETGKGPVVWDVPVLDPAWFDGPGSKTRGRALVALIGFADRGLVAEARALGASACLELPLDLADLVAVLDRLTAPRFESAHELPPGPATRRRPMAHARSVSDARRES